MDLPPGDPPLALALPRHRGPHRLRGPPTERVTEACEHAPRDVNAERLDQMSTEYADPRRVDEQRPRAAEAEDAALGIELEELTEIEIAVLHGRAFPSKGRFGGGSLSL